MDIDEVSFWPRLLPILRSICDATFVAIDLEMSGIPMKGYGSNDRSRLVGKLSLQELYEESREAALKYQVLQVGITCIEEDRERGMYATQHSTWDTYIILATTNIARHVRCSAVQLQCLSTSHSWRETGDQARHYVPKQCYSFSYQELLRYRRCLYQRRSIPL
jgi:hypothetical protein